MQTKKRTPWNKGLKTGHAPWRGKKRPDMTGEKHPSWKKLPGRVSLHSWVARNLGKPNRCEHCGTTTAIKYEWANKSHKYKRDLSDWLRLCVPCHKKYDEPWIKAWKLRREKFGILGRREKGTWAYKKDDNGRYGQLGRKS